MREESKIISEITKSESRLLYYLPEEIERAFAEGRGVVIRDGEKLVGFGLWDFYRDWTELHTLYIAPEYRGRGYLKKIVAEAAEKLKNQGRTNKLFLFTLAPRVASVAAAHRFKNASYFSLPLKTWLAIGKARANPKKLFAYFKHGFHIVDAIRAQLWVLDNSAI